MLKSQEKLSTILLTYSIMKNRGAILGKPLMLSNLSPKKRQLFSLFSL